MKTNRYKAIVMGGSVGSMEALLEIFSGLPRNFRLPIIIVCHVHLHDNGGVVNFFRLQNPLNIKTADDKEPIRPGYIYFAPANYHLLVEQDETFSLTVDSKVNYSRPAIDVLFESAAFVYGEQLIGIVLTGANHDGAKGISCIKKMGGQTIAQNPDTAECPVMPLAAINTGDVDAILSIQQIRGFIKLEVVS
ncbi:chemotaxis protein CheB [Desulfobacter hydrogenophilus]|uniref:protein-glutamate methylesterase n=1 Tax=Desulfobacter hydrogenophilus TaxID=2291 RepID=A0A328F9H7_9BACT|nr:chemotaxis protein CheB [Desulfobacter hydrogenophilus]NDY73797.1 chemotaxis protein CheB [Desulfobacter hydrogenophilus]QBH14619.1 chemotaxis protein CheB [Desulfobacter hydrogenophilus]RAM01019.1 chemotaxis protein CheB [Desulfobacter hydrogenophilus]